MEPLRFSLMFLLVIFGAYSEYRADEYLRSSKCNRGNTPADQTRATRASGSHTNPELDCDTPSRDHRHSELDYNLLFQDQHHFELDNDLLYP